MKRVPMPAVCASAAYVLATLTDGLDVGGSRSLIDPSGERMPVEVERDDDRYTGAVFSGGQYHRAQGGGRIWDPRVVYGRSPAGDWIPARAVGRRGLESHFSPTVRKEQQGLHGGRTGG